MWHSIKEPLRYLLSRQPGIYEGILRLKGNVNFEKVLFLNLVRDGDIVFDVGANRGYYTLLFSHLVGGRGQVHAFEPIPPTFKALSLSIASGKRFNNVRLNRVAVGDHAGTAELYMPGQDDGQASLRKHSFGSWKNVSRISTFECQAVRLDDYTSTRPLNHLDFIKCDVEGAELLALKGATKTLLRFAPILFLEVCGNWTANFDYSPVEIVRYLRELGYSRFHLVTESGRLLENPATNPSSEVFSGSTNLLFTIPALHDLRVSNLLNKYQSN